VEWTEGGDGRDGGGLAGSSWDAKAALGREEYGWRSGGRSTSGGGAALGLGSGAAARGDDGRSYLAENSRVSCSMSGLGNITQCSLKTNNCACIIQFEKLEIIYKNHRKAEIGP
jgi:hypothetical protein